MIAPQRTERFIYVDEAGEPVGCVDRIDESDGKRFLQFRYENGRYVAGLNGAKLPLFRLPDVRSRIERGQIVFVTEGERKANTLALMLRDANIHAVVTTIAGGCNAKLRAEHVEQLRGVKNLVFLADSDDDGRKAARVRSQAALSAFTDAEIRNVDLFPDRTDGSDVADYFAEGGTVDDLRALVKAAAPCKAPEPRPKAPTENHDFQSIAELYAEPDDDETAYLVEGMLPAGSSNLANAKPKVGKTILALNLARSVARGEPFLGRATEKGAVLYVALEGPKKMWKGLLRALGMTADDDFYIFIGRAPEKATEWLRAKAAQHKPALIIIDTFQLFTRLDDINDYAKVTNATAPLIEIAQTFGSTLLWLHHAKKKNEGDDGDSVLGSTALYANVDTMIILKLTAEKRRTISTRQRYGEDMEEAVLSIEQASKTVSIAGTRANVDREEREAQIVALLAGRPDDDAWPTREELFEEAGGRNAISYAALNRLVKDNEIQRIGAGGRKGPYRYAALGKPKPATDSEKSGTTGTTFSGNAEAATNAAQKDSFLPVPAYSGEQVNKNRETSETPNSDGLLSCSRINIESTEVGNRQSGAGNNLFREPAEPPEQRGTPGTAGTTNFGITRTSRPSEAEETEHEANLYLGVDDGW